MATRTIPRAAGSKETVFPSARWPTPMTFRAAHSLSNAPGFAFVLDPRANVATLPTHCNTVSARRSVGQGWLRIAIRLSHHFPYPRASSCSEISVVLRSSLLHFYLPAAHAQDVHVKVSPEFKWDEAHRTTFSTIQNALDHAPEPGPNGRLFH